MPKAGLGAGQWLPWLQVCAKGEAVTCHQVLRQQPDPLV